MRNLTIKRAKRFVACLGTMKVYIEDPTANDLTINGCTCRKLGTLKNGEEKTFAVSEAAARVFVIADTLSTGFCNEYYPLPEGTEDIILTGKNCFNPAAGNAFRFDGVTDEAVLRNRQKGTNKGIIVLVVALIVGLIVGGIIGGGILGVRLAQDILYGDGEPKEFMVADLRITLTDRFSDLDVQGYTGGFQSREVAVLILQENRTILEAAGVDSLTEYAALVQKANNHNYAVKEDEYFLYYEYSYIDPSTGDRFHYFITLHKNPVDFYIVQFAVPEEKTEEYHDTVMEWARSVKVN